DRQAGRGTGVNVEAASRILGRLEFLDGWTQGPMHLLARFKGPNGEIRVLEDPVTGARLYEEGRVAQSRVLPGGEADVLYIRLMASLLTGSPAALLLGCGGGSLASMLCRRGSRVAVVEVNPISFQLARTFF